MLRVPDSAGLWQLMGSLDKFLIGLRCRAEQDNGNETYLLGHGSRQLPRHAKVRQLYLSPARKQYICSYRQSSPSA